MVNENPFEALQRYLEDGAVFTLVCNHGFFQASLIHDADDNVSMTSANNIAGSMLACIAHYQRNLNKLSLKRSRSHGDAGSFDPTLI